MLTKINLYLGAGRSLEAFFSLVLLTWAGQILWSPEALRQSLALRDYYWIIPHQVVGLAILAIGFLCIIGVSLNIAGVAWSRWVRMLAALLSMFVWLFMLGNIFQETNGGYGGVVPWLIWAVPASARAFYFGIINLPRPGAPGLVVWPPILAP